ncbi:MAG: oxidoreductase [Ramlibacter sp.]|jgi:hypothetical protein|nr:oxidoreductase [Ramlibacter sp.]
MQSADPGLQPQRTALAWNRTTLALAINALLVLRAGLQTGDRALLALGALVGIAAVAIAVAAMRRRRQLAHGVYAPATALIASTALAVMLAASGGLWAMLR